MIDGRFWIPRFFWNFSLWLWLLKVDTWRLVAFIGCNFGFVLFSVGIMDSGWLKFWQVRQVDVDLVDLVLISLELISLYSINCGREEDICHITMILGVFSYFAFVCENDRSKRYDWFWICRLCWHFSLWLWLLKVNAWNLLAVTGGNIGLAMEGHSKVFCLVGSGVLLLSILDWLGISGFCWLLCGTSVSWVVLVFFWLLFQGVQVMVSILVLVCFGGLGVSLSRSACVSGRWLRIGGLLDGAAGFL
ncbi:hypothetical protein M5K25_005732 [Dendrobium thyrsiflorum]|uniref:Transmembrane protein n=1 Tax=Dendrobium thyrsiflorum TaxID=117978 RepID=A0ABD0VIL4_DENTH